MTTIDFSPLYRSSIGFDRMASILDATLRGDQTSAGYPPYNIEVTDENRYAITLAIAGFSEDELDIQVEKGVLTVKGRKGGEEESRKYLHQGIANRAFERKFNLADHIEVRGADLKNGLLTISLVKEVPEAAKPRSIQINGSAKRSDKVLEHDASANEDNAETNAA
ncbi:Hsp20 family protein [Allohahella sp. A8]|uniref:Hsp20 family protein n=1 Tax=Allohahella sp. A8 TaxID=3141461 RepID=UPI000C097421|nr:heat-shock protein [Hahellaceae bacterium]